MVAWWDSLSLAGQIYAAIAIPATVVMLVQAILLLVGVGIDGDVDGDGVPDADLDSDGLGLISIRGIVAFFSIGGWAGFVADAGGLPVAVSVLIAFAAGLIALFGVAFLFKSFYKLQGSGNLMIENAVGKAAKVYLTVPPKGQGHGKVNLLLQEQLVELDALNAGDTPFLTGQSVIVCSVADSQTVVVKGLDTEKNATNRGGISKWN